MHRGVWERTWYQEAALHILRIEEYECIILVDSTYMMQGEKKVYTASKGQRFPYLGREGGWAKTKVQDQILYLQINDIDVVPKEK